MTGTFNLAIFLTCMMFMYMGSFFAAGRAFADVTRWVLLGVLCLLAAWGPRALRGSFSGGGVRMVGYAFAGLALLSSVWSSEKSIYTFMRGGSVILLSIFVFNALWSRLRRVKDYAALTKVLSATAWATAAASGFLYVVARADTVRPFTHAFQGLFGNPNMLGMVYSVLMPVSLARFHLKKRPLTLGLPCVLVAMVYLSQSRAGLVGCIFGTAVFYACYYRKKMWIALVVCFFALIPYVVLQRDAGVLDEAEQNFLRGESDIRQFGSGRYGLWMVAFDRFKKRPFTGYGFGTGGDLYLASGEPFRYHSSFTQITVELGIPGLLFFIAPIAYAGFKVARYQLVPMHDYRARAVIAGLMGGWLGGALDSCFESWLFSVGNVASLLAWICFAGGVKAISEATMLDSEAGANAETKR